MARKPDLYTVGQASIALGVSIKRVRQMLQEGKLEVYSRNPITIKQLEVLEMRSKREVQGKSVTASVPTSRKSAQDNAELLAAFEKLIGGVNESHRLAIEMSADSARRNEENLMATINDLKAELANLKSQPVKGRWYRR